MKEKRYGPELSEFKIPKFIGHILLMLKLNSKSFNLDKETKSIKKS